MPNLKPSIPYPSRCNDERRPEKANYQIEKFYEIFKDLSFEISLTDALILMPKFASTLKALIGNKEKLSKMARTPLNEHCSAVILNKLPKKLGDPGKFLIPCDFPGMNECLALAVLPSIKLMPLIACGKDFYLPKLTLLVHSLGRDKGSLALNELTVLCTTLSKKVEDLHIDLQQTKKAYSSALTKLILRVKKLEKQVRQAKIGEESFYFIEQEPTDIVEDQGSGEKGEKEVSTVGAEHSTVILEVNTATENLVYIRRSAEKKKDKGKGIMIESEPEKNTKKQLEQERLRHEEAVRARQEQEIVAKDDQAYVIDWSDHAVLRYHALQNRPYSVAEVRKNMCIYLKNREGFKISHFKEMSYEEIRPIFERVWDQNQSFVPMDSEKEKGSK
ncbi:hypothetical protein Tco_0719046 [Tanacetum coccineum]